MRPSEIHDTMVDMYQVKIPVYLTGSPGGGKTEVMRQLAARLQAAGLGAEEVQPARYECYTLHAQIHDPSDFKFPIVDTKKMEMRWICSLFPQDPNFCGLVFIDELDKCNAMNQTCILQLALERRLGEYKLPDGAWLVMAGNRMEDKTGSHQIISALRNRCTQIEFDVSTEDWNTWALDAGIHTDVRSYIKLRPDMLNKFDPNKPSCPTPRSWEFTSRYLGKVKERYLQTVLAGTIGDGAATEFVAHRQIAAELPDPMLVLRDPKKAPIPVKEPACMYALVCAITELCRDKNKDGMANAKQAWQYALRLPKEYSIFLGKDLAHVNRKSLDAKEAEPWIRENRDLLINSYTNS